MPKIKLFSYLRISGSNFFPLKKLKLAFVFNFCSRYLNNTRIIDLEFASREYPDHFPSKKIAIWYSISNLCRLYHSPHKVFLRAHNFPIKAEIQVSDEVLKKV